MKFPDLSSTNVCDIPRPLTTKLCDKIVIFSSPSVTPNFTRLLQSISTVKIQQQYSDILALHMGNTYIRPFNGLLSGTNWLSQHQTGKTNLDLLEQDSVSGSGLGHNQADNHASTLPLSFLQAACPSCCPTNSIKALKAISSHWRPCLKFSLTSSKIPRLFQDFPQL